MPYGRGVLVSASHLACKDRDKVLEHLVAFEGWVHGSEPGVLTYAIMTRPKAPNEILIVVRYNGGKAMNSHDQAPEHLAVGAKVGPLLDAKNCSTTLWREVDDSFVTNAVGVESVKSSGSKL